MIMKNLRYNKIIFPFICYIRQLYLTAYGNFCRKDSSEILKAVALILLPVVAPYYLLWGWYKVVLQQKKDKITKFKYQLTLVGIVKNEASYLREWIEYYRLIGVDHFVIYDNGSTDETVKVVSSVNALRGRVELVNYPGKIMQVKAYNDAVERFKEQTRYMMFVDIDEFVVTKESSDDILRIVRSLTDGKHVGGVALSWLMFGSNGHKVKPKGLVIENYTHRANDMFMNNIKSIANPRFISMFVNPHYPIYKYGLSNVNERGLRVVASLDYHKSTKRVWVNHYFTKSAEECMEKIRKGIATVGMARTESIFNERDKNDIYDGTILRYVNDLNQAINEYSKEK